VSCDKELILDLLKHNEQIPHTIRDAKISNFVSFIALAFSDCTVLCCVILTTRLQAKLHFVRFSFYETYSMFV